MTLHRNSLRPEANVLFEMLYRAPEMKGLTLIGGTALALQLNHRISLDFDFAQFGGTLPGIAIDRLVSRLKQEGHHKAIMRGETKLACDHFRAKAEL